MPYIQRNLAKAIIGRYAVLQPGIAEEYLLDNAPEIVNIQREEGRKFALESIDSAAEAARQRFITPGAGQAMTYLRKEQSARAYQAAGYSGNVPPLLAATAAGRGITAAQAAELIIAQADQWETIGAAIEKARESGKAAIAAGVRTSATDTVSARM